MLWRDAIAAAAVLGTLACTTTTLGYTPAQDEPSSDDVADSDAGADNDAQDDASSADGTGQGDADAEGPSDTEVEDDDPPHGESPYITSLLPRRVLADTETVFTFTGSGLDVFNEVEIDGPCTIEIISSTQLTCRSPGLAIVDVSRTVDAQLFADDMAAYLFILDTVTVYSPGARDHRFGGDGIVTLSDILYDVALAADGTLIGVGSRPGDGVDDRQAVVVALESDGSVATSFAGVGRFEPTMECSSSLHAIAIDPVDGEFILAGQSWGGDCGQQTLVVRLIADGSYNTDFGPLGTYTLETNATQQSPAQLHLRSDGTLWLVANTDGPEGEEIMVAGIDDQGITSQTRVAGVATNSTLDSDDTIFIVGSSSSAVQERRLFLFDQPALTTGVVLEPDTNATAGAVLLTGSGNLLVAGAQDVANPFFPAYSSESTFSRAFVSQHTATDLELMATFNSVGWWSNDNASYDGYDTVSDMLLQSDGSLLVIGGSVAGGQAPLGIFVVRLTSTGSLDTDFGRFPTQGSVNTVVPNADAECRAATYDASNNALICVGWTDTGGVVVRYWL